MTFMWLRELPSWITAFEDFQGCIPWTILRLNFIYCLKNPRCCLQLYPPVLISQSSNCYLSQSFANMSSGSAKIGQPAPDFTGKAVVNRQFKDLKLSDYRGKGLLLCSCGKVAFTNYSKPNFLSIILRRKVCCFLLLPSGLHICVSHRDRGLQRQGRGLPQHQLRGDWLLHRLPLHPSGMVRNNAEWKEVMLSLIEMIILICLQKTPNMWK